MSDGLGRASGAPVTFEIDGKTYILEGIKQRDFGTIEQHLLSQRESPFDAIQHELPKIKNAADRQALLKMALEAKINRKANKIPHAEVMEWIDSPTGVVYTTWLSLRKNHPEADLELAQKVVDKMGEDEMRRLRDIASGLDPTTGPTAAPAQNPNDAAKQTTLPMPSQSQSTGDESIAA